jgi:hypothetical protein
MPRFEDIKATCGQTDWREARRHIATGTLMGHSEVREHHRGKIRSFFPRLATKIIF